MEKWILNVALLKKMKKIAVIDTGIDLQYRDFKGKNIEIADIREKKMHKDLNGHGTSCCGEILKYNPMASLVVIPVLNKNCTCSLKDLYSALLYCCYRKDIGIINLSLSCNIEDDEIIGLFELLVNKMYQNGKVLIASNKNKIKNREKIYPYNIENVLGVTKSSVIYPYILFDSTSNNCEVSSDFYFMPSVNNKYKVFYGNSSLTAQITGLLSSEIDKLKEKEITINKLLFLCNKKLENIYMLENEFGINTRQNQVQIQMKKERLNKIWLVFNSKKYKAIHQCKVSEREFYNDNGGKFLQLLERELGFQFDFKRFTTEDLKYINILIEKCFYYKL